MKIALFLLVLSLASPLAAGESALGLRFLNDEQIEAGRAGQLDEAGVVKELYFSYGRSLARSGSASRIRVSNFQTWPLSKFGEVNAVDIASFSPEYELAVASTRVLTPTDQLVGVALTAAWQPGTSSSAQVAQVSTLAQLREALLAESEWSRAVALTSFDVEARVQGRTAEYRAAALWSDANRDGIVELHVIDNVLARVGEVASLGNQVGVFAELQRKALEAIPEPVGARATRN